MMREQHELEMALTQAEFLRLLPVAVGTSFQMIGSRVSGTQHGIAWDIDLFHLPPRRIALLELPRLRVTVALDAEDAVHAKAWMDRFMLGYQRAGG